MKSTRYNALSFLPVSLLLQFTKVINCFYLVNMVLQMIPSISTNEWYFTAFPLCVIIGLGILKEGLADFARYRQDRRVNLTPACKVQPAESDAIALKSIFTKDILVGDIIQVLDDETVPADCLLLSTDPSRKDQLGQCFISTGNLDGERNLKPKMAI